MRRLNRPKSNLVLAAAVATTFAGSRLSRAASSEQTYGTLGATYQPNFGELPYSSANETNQVNDPNNTTLDTIPGMFYASKYPTESFASDWNGWYGYATTLLRGTYGNPNGTGGAIFDFSNGTGTQALGAISTSSTGNQYFGVELENTNSTTSINHVTLTFTDNLWYEGTAKTLSFGYAEDTTNPSTTTLSSVASGLTNVPALASTATPVSGTNAGLFTSGGTASGTTAVKTPLATEQLSTTLSINPLAPNQSIWLVWSFPSSSGAQGIGINGLKIVGANVAPDVWTNGSSDGLWNIQSSYNWTVSGASAQYVDGDAVSFAGGGMTNLLSTVTIAAGGVNPSGGIGVSNSTGTYKFVNATNPTAGIGGTGGLTLSGSGTLDMSGLSTTTGANTYSGGTSIGGGTLVISNDNQLGATSGAVSISNGALAITGGSVTSPSARAYSISGGGATFLNGGYGLILNAALTAGGPLTTIGSGSVDLAAGLNNGTFSGNVTIGSGGALVLGGSSATINFASGGAFNGDIALVNAARFNFDGTNTYGGGGNIYILGSTLGASIAGKTATSGSLANNVAMITNVGSGGGGTLTSNVVLDPANNGSDLTGSQGTFVPGVITGANYQFGSFVAMVAATTSANTLALGDSSHANGGISGGGDVIIGQTQLTGGGGGQLILNGASTYTGNTLINNTGTITLGVVNALPTTTNIIFGSLKGANSPFLDLNGNNQTIASISTDAAAGAGSLLTVTNSSTTTPAALTFTGSVTPGNAFNGAITGNLSVAQNGTNTITLSGSNSYTGSTTVSSASSGTLQLSSGSIKGTGVAVNSGGNFGGTGTVTPGVVLAAGGTVFEGSSTTPGTLNIGALTVSGGTLNFRLGSASDLIAIASGGALTETGSGVVNVSAAANLAYGYYPLINYSSLVKNGGALTLNTSPQNQSTSQPTGFSLVVGATSTSLDVYNPNIHNLVWSYGATAPSASSGTDGSGGWANGVSNFFDENSNKVVAWDSTAVNNLSFGTLGVGGGVITLGGPVTVGGSLTFLPVSNPYTFSSASGQTYAIQLDSSVYAQNSATLDSTVNVTMATSINFDVSALQTLTIGGTLSETGGSQSLAKLDSGTLTLTGNNSYSGGTSIQGGVLSINSDNSLGATTGASGGAVSINAGTLQFAGAVSSARAFTLTNGATIDTAGNTSSINGAIGGTGSLTVGDSVGGGILSLTVSNAYSGGTTITGGTLVIENDNQLGSGNITLAGGTLSDSTSGSNSTGIASTKKISLQSSTSSFFNTAGLSSTYSTISASGTLTVNGASGGALSVGSLSGASNLVISSGNTLNDTNATYTSGSGILTINSSGTIALGGSGTLSQGIINGNLVMASNSASTLNVITGTVSGTGSVVVPVTGSSILNPSSSNSATLNANVSLNPTGGSAFTKGNVQSATYAPGNFVTNLGLVPTATGSTLTLGGAISGYSDVNISNGTTNGGGVGNLVLAAASSYQGATAINAASGSTITLGVAGALPSNTDVIVGSTSKFGLVTLDLDGNTQQIASLSDGADAGTSSAYLTVTNSSTSPATLVVGGSATPANAFIGAIQNGPNGGGVVNLTKQGTGYLKLDNSGGIGSSYTYTGTTTVSGGTLQLTAKTTLSGGGPVNVNGGVFGGNGIVTGPVTVGTGSGAGAVLFAGGAGATSTGSLTVQNNVTINSDGILQIRIQQPTTVTGVTDSNGVVIQTGTGTEATNNDTLFLTGTSSNTFNFNASTLNVVPVGTFSKVSNLNYTYTIVDGTTNAEGVATNSTFSGLANGATYVNGVYTEGGLSYSLTYQPDDIMLNVTSVPEPGSLGLFGIAGAAMLHRRRRRLH